MGSRRNHHWKALCRLQGGPAPGDRFARCGFLAALSTAGIRWAVLFILACAKIPMAMAAMAVLLPLGGQHEVQVGFSANRLDITFHHPHAVNGHSHHHTAWESLLICAPPSPPEPDHHVQFAHDHAAFEPEELESLTNSPASGHSHAETFPTAAFPPALPKRRIAHGHWPAAIPPMTLRRGVVMRI